MDPEALIGEKLRGGSVINSDQGSRINGEELFGLECDILIPAAKADVIHEDNVNNVKARLIVQGANIPITSRAEQILHERGVLVIPDFIANAGGVIMAAMEYAGRTEQEAFAAIAERIGNNTRRILENSAIDVARHRLRAVADAIAMERVLGAMAYRDY